MKIVRVGDPNYRRYQTASGKTKWQVYWQIEDQVGRTFRRFKKGLSTRQAAEIFFRKAVLEPMKEDRLTLDSSAGPEVSASTLGNLVEIYLQEGCAGKSERAKATDKNSLDRLLEVIPASTPLPLLTSRHIDRFKTAREEAKKKPSTINRDLSAIRHMFATAVRWRLLEDTPFRGVKMLKVPEGDVVYLEPEEQQALLKACAALDGHNSRNDAPYLRPLVALALYTGLRQEELFNLRWYQLDLENAVLHIVNREDFKTKSRRNRVVGLSPGAIRELRTWQDWFPAEIARASERAADQSLHRRIRSNASLRHELLLARAPAPDRLVFPSFREQLEDGTPAPLNNIKRSLARARKNAGLQRKKGFGLHALRHTFAVTLARQGVPLVTIAGLMGHADMQTTQIYLRFQPTEGVLASTKIPDIDAAPAKVLEVASG